MSNFKKAIILAFLVFITISLFGQTAAKLEVILNENTLTWQQVTEFILEAAEIDTGTTDPFQYASQQNWLPVDAVSGERAQLNGVSLLLMQSFYIRGGIFYRLFQGPHHAYRELVYLNVIRGNTDPLNSVSGQQLLLMINRIYALLEEGLI